MEDQWSHYNTTALSRSPTKHGDKVQRSSSSSSRSNVNTEACRGQDWLTAQLHQMSHEKILWWGWVVVLLTSIVTSQTTLGYYNVHSSGNNINLSLQSYFKYPVLLILFIHHYCYYFLCGSHYKALPACRVNTEMCVQLCAGTQWGQRGP